jgi:hypothetical protein
MTLKRETADPLPSWSDDGCLSVARELVQAVRA